ncbi:hypothetical protein EVG20_g8267 [Dentipellis fragilis]|uniref:Uncharacterized protein n=1 Tax=Dentipellis fragilis TaxID=205917 RepID=A0A4Y9Y710_9AGAM|nr:hypothetical protein EVG20_g8267 [Dentipellis fragilis]
MSNLERARGTVEPLARASQNQLPSGLQMKNENEKRDGIEATSESKNVSGEDGNADGDKYGWKRDVLPVLLAFYLPKLGKA